MIVVVCIEDWKRRPQVHRKHIHGTTEISQRHIDAHPDTITPL
jgi:hypothetical protein